MRKRTLYLVLIVLGVTVPAIAGSEAGRATAPTYPQTVLPMRGFAQPSLPSASSPTMNANAAAPQPLLDSLPSDSDAPPLPPAAPARAKIEHASPWDGVALPPAEPAVPLVLDHDDPWNGSPIPHAATPRMALDPDDPWSASSDLSL